MTAARASQLIQEALDTGARKARVSQLVVEKLTQNTIHHAYVSQLLVEFLVANVPPMTYLIFPALRGLGWNYLKREKWSTNVGSHVSGREKRLALWQFPLWEWELSYDWLPDAGAQGSNGTTVSDLQEIMGFFGAVAGSQQTFLYEDPDDKFVIGQPLGVGDGSTTTFTFVRSFGSTAMGGAWGTSGAFTEPVGRVNQAVTLNVYVADSLVDPSQYTIDTSVLLNSTVHFLHGGIALGDAITADFGYYFAARFKDDTLDWEKFAAKIWEQKKLTLMSTRE